MAKRSNQKLKLLYLYRILLGSTDESHGLTLSEISAELGKYGITAERKTLYDDLEALKLFGVDLRVKRDRHVRYYVGNKGFSDGESKLITDLVNSSALISEKEKESLLQRLSSRGAKSAALIGAENDVLQSSRESALGAIELFCKAVAQNRKMRGRYFCWNARKQRIMQFGGERIRFSPWYIDLSEKVPRVIVYLDGQQKLVPLRPDRFIDIEILRDERDGENEFFSARRDDSLRELLELSAPLMLRMRADNSLADEIIDRFGTGITIISNNENDFEFSVKARADGELYSWVFCTGGRAEILAPQSAREGYLKLTSLY